MFPTGPGDRASVCQLGTAVTGFQALVFVCFSTTLAGISSPERDRTGIKSRTWRRFEAWERTAGSVRLPDRSLLLE